MEELRVPADRLPELVEDCLLRDVDGWVMRWPNVVLNGWRIERVFLTQRGVFVTAPAADWSRVMFGAEEVFTVVNNVVPEHRLPVRPVLYSYEFVDVPGLPVKHPEEIGLHVMDYQELLTMKQAEQATLRLFESFPIAA